MIFHNKLAYVFPFFIASQPFPEPVAEKICTKSVETVEIIIVDCCC